jgi:hypothetical protein
VSVEAAAPAPAERALFARASSVKRLTSVTNLPPPASGSPTKGIDPRSRVGEGAVVAHLGSRRMPLGARRQAQLLHASREFASGAGLSLQAIT